MKNLSLTALALVAMAAVPATAADWSDTSFQYRTGTSFQEPANPDKLKKDIFNLTHVSGYSLGSNFFSVDMLKSEAKDPANAAGSNGAQEVYVAYKHDLNLSKVLGMKLDFGPVRGVTLSTGFDYNAKNTQFAPSVFKIMAGPTFSLKVPGFLNVGVLYYNEKNHNAFGGFALSRGGAVNVSFKPTYQIAAAWGIPVALGDVSTSVKGFATYTGAKGKDGSGVPTSPETLARIYWMADLSPVFGCKKGTWQVGPGLEYWNNKFGDPTFATVAEAHSYLSYASVNPKTQCLMLAVEVHF